MASILLLEDDFKLSMEVKTLFSQFGYSCDTVYDGLVFFRQLAHYEYDLYILDINIPSLNGNEVCRRIRESNSKIPILMLTAYGDIEDKISAFKLGADDYLVKPFHSEELIARVKALLRRSDKSATEAEIVYRIGELEIDTLHMKVTRAGKTITLSPKEYKLLELLASYKGRVVSKQIIAEKVWDFETSSNTIEVYINFIRNKIDKGFSEPLIHTRTGFGYYIKMP